MDTALVPDGDDAMLADILGDAAGTRRPGRLHACGRTTVLARVPGRILNVHPSSCRRFPAPTRSAMPSPTASKVTGATVHLVDETLDGGPILAPGVVPILADDTRGRCTRGSRPWSIACCRGLCARACPGRER